MKKLLILMLLLPCIVLAAPATIQLQFEEPTTNTDLSVLDNLSFYQGYCATTPSGPYLAVETLPAPIQVPLLNSILQITLSNCMSTIYGDVYYVVTAVNLLGESSAFSNEVHINYPDNRVPSAPANLRVIATTP